MKKHILAIGMLMISIISVYAQQNSKEINALEQVELGGVNQWILARGSDASNPILLFLHGGPGFPEMPFTHVDSKNLEQCFIVVNWDQRGAGKTGSNGTIPELMNIDHYLSETHELIEYLKIRFQKEKVFLIGHSWGSILGLLTAYKYPKDIYAYIGMGQVVDMRKSENLSYNFVLDKAKKNNDTEVVNQLVEIGVPDNWTSFQQIELQRRILGEYGGVFKKLSYQEIGKFWYSSPYYTLQEKQDLMETFANTQKMMRPLYMKVNLKKEVRKLKVPVYFFIGRNDYVTHFDLVVDYCKNLKSPYKEIIWFEESGHHPNLEEPLKYQDMLINRVLKKLSK
jgi:pimeloyl-ACP methyl ester carboxylesterase